MKRRTILAASAVFSLAACMCRAEAYDATTGYVTLSRQGTGGFTGADGWSDGMPPHSGTNYYISATGSLHFNNANALGMVFPGDRLVVEGKIEHSVGWGGKFGWGEVEFLPGAIYYYWSPGEITNGSWTVSATAENPFLIQYSRDDNPVNYQFTWPQSFSSPESGYAKIMLRPDKTDTEYAKFQLTGSWEGYKGTFEITSAHKFQRYLSFVCPGTFKVVGDGTSLQFGSGSTAGRTYEIGNLAIADGALVEVYQSIVCPGTVSLSGGGSCLRFRGNAQQSIIGVLSVGAGALLSLSDPAGYSGADNNTVFVTNRLEFAAGAKVYHSLCAKAQTGYVPEAELLFVLSPEAYAAGLPDFDKVEFVDRHASRTSNGPLPRTCIRVDEQANGGAKIYIVQREIVNHTAVDNYQASSLDETRSGEVANLWSNGQFPSGEYDYYATWLSGIGSTSVSFLKDDQKVFKGGLLFLNQESTTIFIDIPDVTISNLWLSSKAYIRPWTSSFARSFTLRGRLSVPNGGIGRVQIGDGHTLTIESDLGGEGTFQTKYGNESTYTSKIPQNRHGTIVLAGDNRAFAGKLHIGMPSGFNDHAGEVVPGPDTNITVKVSDGYALGGELPEFTADAVIVSNHCRLAITDDACFSAMTRGWYLPDFAYLKVEAGKEAVVSNSVTYTAISRIVKEGGGTLAFCSAAIVEGSGAEFVVQSGGVKVGVSGAFNGLAVKVNPAAKLVIDGTAVGNDLAYRGIDFSGVGTSLSGDGFIAVEIDARHLALADAIGKEFSVMTLPEATVPAMAARLNVYLVAADETRHRRIAVRANGDGTSTLTAIPGIYGLCISFK